MKSVVPPASTKKANLPETEIQRGDAVLDLKEVFENSSIAFCATDAKGLLTFFNTAAVALLGREPELGREMLFSSWKIFYSDGTPMPVEDSPMAKVLAEGRAYENERIDVERADGGISKLLVFSRPVFDSQGSLKSVNHTMVDITEQREVDLKQETLSAIVESSDDAVISRDLQGNINSWNRGAEKIFGYTEAEILGKSVSKLIPENRLEDENVILNKILKGHRVDHFETIRRHKEGFEIPVSLTVSPLKDSQGNIVGASKVARDISERLKGEEKQAILSAIVESSDDAIVSKNLNGTIMSWNKGAQQIFGYSEQEVLGRSITMLIPQGRLQEEDLILNKIKRGQKIDHFETIRKHKNGNTIYVSLTVSPLKDKHGRVVGASKIARDITSEMRAKAEIQEHTRNLEILNTLGRSISRKMEVRAVLQQVTEATTKLSGASYGSFFYKKEKGEGFQLFTISGAAEEDFQGLEMPGITELFHATFSEGEVVRMDDVAEDPRYKGLPEGHPEVKSYLAVPVGSASGNMIGGILLGHPEAGKFTRSHEDLVTNIAAQAAIALDNSRLFEQVKSLSDKKDEFIALASHELRTPLTTINGYLQVLTKREKDQMSELFLNKSLYQVNKLNTLVEDLLNMSRIEAGKMEFNTEEFDLRDLLEEVTETFGYTTKTHQLIHDLGESPVPVKADRQRIEQAINNLMSNAVKYSPKADKVYLKVERRDGHVRVAVKDEGIGLTGEQQKKLFSRFYRAGNNKGISGLGLGLYLTKQIIDQHDGTLSLQSTYGKGSEFSFSLPLLTLEKK